MKKAIILVYFIVFPIGVLAEKADLIIYSYDRPMQLWALWESIEEHVENIGDIAVIYRASNQDFANGYQEVQQKFNNATYFQQSNTPKQDFKPLTMHCLYHMPHEHVLFAVDDIIVKEKIDLSECIRLLEETNSYGFYLRLGLHLSECYSMKVKQAVPQAGTVIQEHYFLWKFNDGQYDWKYPHSVDMTVYRKKQIISQLERLAFNSPNTLEGSWAGRAGHVMGLNGICCIESPMVNLPLNRVQNDAHNRHMGFMSSKELLNLFNSGMKIDIKPLRTIVHKAAHMEYVPTFIPRVRAENNDV